MKVDFDIPVVMNPPATPAVQDGVMSHSQPFVAKAAHQEPLGFSGRVGGGLA